VPIGSWWAACSSLSCARDAASNPRPVAFDVSGTYPPAARGRSRELFEATLRCVTFGPPSTVQREPAARRRPFGLPQHNPFAQRRGLRLHTEMIPVVALHRRRAGGEHRGAARRALPAFSGRARARRARASRRSRAVRLRGGASHLREGGARRGPWSRGGAARRDGRAASARRHGARARDHRRSSARRVAVLRGRDGRSDFERRDRSLARARGCRPARSTTRVGLARRARARVAGRRASIFEANRAATCSHAGGGSPPSGAGAVYTAPTSRPGPAP
jgi:hypothetical protein